MKISEWFHRATDEAHRLGVSLLPIVTTVSLVAVLFLLSFAFTEVVIRGEKAEPVAIQTKGEKEKATDDAAISKATLLCLKLGGVVHMTGGEFRCTAVSTDGTSRGE